MREVAVHGRAGVPSDCDALVVAGSQRAWPAEDAAALERYLDYRWTNGIGTFPPMADAAYRGFRYDLPLFITRKGGKFGKAGLGFWARRQGSTVAGASHHALYSQALAASAYLD